MRSEKPIIIVMLSTLSVISFPNAAFETDFIGQGAIYLLFFKLCVAYVEALVKSRAI